MSLTLEITGGPYAGQVRVLDGSRPFTVGTMRDCQWILPTTGRDEIKVTVRASTTGFEMTPEGDVSMEGQPLVPEKAIEIGHGSQITIAEHALTARIEQTASTAWDTRKDEFSAPTISSILSDVAPGGAGASGPLPGRAGEEWMSKDPLLPQGDGTVAAIPSANAFGSRLPDDWNIPDDRKNQQMQAPATDQVIHINTPKEKPAEVSAPVGHSTDLLKLFVEAAGLSMADITADPEAIMRAAGQTLRAAIEGIEQLEQEAQRFEAELGLNALPASDVDRAAASLDVLLGFAGVDTANQIRARANALAGKQRAISMAIDATLLRARQDMAPDSIQTKAAADGGLPFGKKSQYWDTYIKEWSAEDAPLGKDAFRDAYDTATGGLTSGKEDK
ncbi:type VI secretion system-associated FHA domain protein [Pseudaestuariivita rosea]|uniref:type VI secretion system-associated FHA domain protein n=1 Tax=Pseudaestuariivita rosea TaxID=2763263 RepID=UPI001ABA1C19|nr:type VI secretion system-associated FHA domain protein [Pseudaestuariivita rosea]